MSKGVRTLFLYVLPVLATLVVLFQCCHLWAVSLYTPLIYHNDVLVEQFVVKTIAQTQWTMTNPWVGAPGTFQYYDYPMMGDSFNQALLWVLLIFSKNVFLITNLFYFLRFALTTATSLYVLRQFKISYLVAAALSVVYAFIPYNLLRGEGHLYLGTYYVVPLVTAVVLWSMRGELSPDFRNRKFLLGLLFCLITAGNGIYYAFFAGALLGFSSLYLLVAGPQKSFRPALAAFLMACTILGATLLLVLPTLLFQLKMGKNPDAGHRQRWEAELYGLKIIQLLLPIPNHWLTKAALKAQSYNLTFPLVNENRDAALGLLSSVGFLILLYWKLLRSGVGTFLGRLKSSSELSESNIDLMEHLSALNLFSVLLATVGGVGSVIAFLFFPAIRAYNRISIFIAFFSLMAIALFLDQFFIWLRKRLSPWVPVLLMAFITGLAILDQTGRIEHRPQSVLDAFNGDREFFQLISKASVGEAMVFQLPYVSFPESPPVYQMTDYEHLKAYLLSPPNVRWSYPAMRGRATSLWQEEISKLPVLDMVYRLQDKGFTGIYIDRFGYSDEGEALALQLRHVLLSAPLISKDNRKVFFKLDTAATLHYSNAGVPVSITIHKRDQSLLLPKTIQIGRLVGLMKDSDVHRTFTYIFARGDGILDFDYYEHRFATGALPDEAFRSQIHCPQSILRITTDRPEVSVSLSVKNLSSYWWPAEIEKGAPYLLHVRSHLLDGLKRMVNADFDAEAALPRSVAPGGQVEVRVNVSTDRVPAGESYLEFDLIQEGVRWAQGKTCVVKLLK